jgi:hypothetical protein
VFLVSPEPSGFAEEFASSTLDPAWEVVQFTGSRVYGYSSPANHYSLTDNPGRLRYYLDPMTHPEGFWRGFATAAPGEISCCAHDPGIEIRRTVTGEYWLLESKVDFHMPYANGRSNELRVYFGDGNPGTLGVRMVLQRDVNQRGFHVQLREQTGSTILTLVVNEIASDVLGDGSPDEPADETYYVRIERAGSVITTSWSRNGVSWTPAWSHDAGTDLDGLGQTVVITGHSWFVPAGSYADWDYVRLTPTILTLAIDIKPGSAVNPINPTSHGKTPVAILSSADFDAPATVDATSLTFGRTGDEPSLAFCSEITEDVNADGRLDLVCHFTTQQTGFQGGDTEGILKGLTEGGTPIEGRDAVRIMH